MEDILAVLPQRFRSLVKKLLSQKNVEELRLRGGQSLHYISNLGEIPLITDKIKGEDLDFVLARACDYSVHSVQEQISKGFLTMRGGHRIGLCGTAVMERGEIKTLRRLSSISIRFASEHRGISLKVLEKITDKEGIHNTLILSPPGHGKTTLLRDLIRSISSGEGISSQRIGLVDERCEIAGMQHGLPRFDVGTSTDILESCPKALALIFLLRSMNPQILAVDEITAEEDILALTQVSGCGVKLLVTAHGSSLQDLYLRPTYRQLLNLKLFQKLILIRQNHLGRQYQVEDIPC